jgi:hypothetical protein
VLVNPIGPAIGGTAAFQLGRSCRNACFNIFDFTFPEVIGEI